jgi:hypothetical protein
MKKLLFPSVLLLFIAGMAALAARTPEPDF